MIRTFFAAIILFLACGAASVYAQGDPLLAVNARALRLIDSTNSMLNLRYQRFNEELEKVNALKPLDWDSTSIGKLPKTRETIKDFLNYLEVYRTLSGNLKKDVEDSVDAIRSGMPARIKQTYLQVFLDAYSMDQSSFDKYTLAVSKLFTGVDKLLAFIETSHVEVIGNKLQFIDKKEYEGYSEFFEGVQKANKKLITASANSQKAKIDADAMMRKEYLAKQK